MDFLDANYETPQAGGKYAKLQDGKNEFRILAKPVLGWVAWEKQIPYRFPYNAKPDKQFEQPLKHLWIVLVWNYNDKAVQVLEITQTMVQKALADLSRNPRWGLPYEYDIEIHRSGKEKGTKYVVNPLPKSKLPDEAMKAALDNPVYLENLFIKDGDPFKVSDKQTELAFSDLPF